MADVAKAMVRRVVEKRNLNEVVALLEMQIESLTGHGRPDLTPLLQLVSLLLIQRLPRHILRNGRPPNLLDPIGPRSIIYLNSVSGRAACDPVGTKRLRTSRQHLCSARLTSSALSAPRPADREQAALACRPMRGAEYQQIGLCPLGTRCADCEKHAAAQIS
jgi:hypothetical protein